MRACVRAVTHTHAHAHTRADVRAHATQALRTHSPSHALASTRRQKSRYSGAVPFASLANDEGAVDIAWAPDQPTVLGVGVQVWLRLFDLRAGEVSSRSAQAHSGRVHGVCFSPTAPEQVATFGDDCEIKVCVCACVHAPPLQPPPPP